MFNELIDKLTQFKELTVGKFRYDLEDLIKQLYRLETRYNNYERILKEYADPNNWGYNNEFECGYYPAAEALKTEEELQQEQVDKLLQVFKEVDRETVIKATEIYLSKVDDKY